MREVQICATWNNSVLAPLLAKKKTVVYYFLGNLCITFWCRIHLWFRWVGGLHAKSVTSQRYRATYKMADMRYYGNVMTTTRWRICVTMATLWQQQDGGYVILHLQQYSRRLNLYFFLYGFATWLVILKALNTFRAKEKSGRKKIFKTMREEVTEDWKKSILSSCRVCIPC